MTHAQKYRTRLFMTGHYFRSLRNGGARKMFSGTEESSFHLFFQTKYSGIIRALLPLFAMVKVGAKGKNFVHLLLILQYIIIFVKYFSFIPSSQRYWNYWASFDSVGGKNNHKTPSPLRLSWKGWNWFGKMCHHHPPPPKGERQTKN